MGLASLVLAPLRQSNRKPKAKAEIIRATILGLALIEMGIVLALIVALFIIMNSGKSIGNVWQHLSLLGIIPATGVPALFIGYLQLPR